MSKLKQLWPRAQRLKKSKTQMQVGSEAHKLIKLRLR